MFDMKRSLPTLFLTGVMLTAAVPNAFAASVNPVNPPPPGNYISRPLNPSTSPPAPIGYDLVLEENVPGATSSPTPTDGTLSETGTPCAFPAAHVTVDVIISLSNMTSPDQCSQQYLPSTPVVYAVAADVKGPTGTYAAGTVGPGKQSHHTLADVNQMLVPGQNQTVYYQFRYKVTWYYESIQSPGTVLTGHRTVYGDISSYVF